MPFNPKGKQIFHLILCSNYEIGVRATRNFYSEVTGNPKYSPDNEVAFQRFKTSHPEIFIGLSRRQRPVFWKLLWDIITNHEEGICDRFCRDFEPIEKSEFERQRILDWLEGKGYLKRVNNNNAWKYKTPLLKVNWEIVENKLEIKRPASLEPLSLRHVSIKDITK
jgi:hypothetical protein